MIKLKPCPFCGSEARSFHDTMSDYEKYWSWSIECSVCGAETGHSNPTEESAAESWNSRYAPTQVETLIQPLRDLRKTYYPWVRRRTKHTEDDEGELRDAITTLLSYLEYIEESISQDN